MIINDSYIIDEFYFNDKNGKFKVNGKKLSKCSDNEKQYLLNRFNDCDDLKEAVQRIFYKNHYSYCKYTNKKDKKQNKPRVVRGSNIICPSSLE